MKAVAVLFASFVVIVALACGASAKPTCTGATCECKDTSCTCVGGSTCDIICGTFPRCQPSCTNVAQCNAVCRDDCTGKCVAGGTCTMQCNNNCVYDCSNSTQCTVSVGDGSTIDCTGAGTCDVTCAGSCKITGCTGTCKVRCSTSDGSTSEGPQTGCD